MLPNNQYLNFCSQDCGTGDVFNSIRSLADLHNMNNIFTGQTKYAACEVKERQKWVYFHAACQNKKNPDQQVVAKVKGDVQKAVFEWVKEIQ